ncbi:tyrosine-protein phosphatase [Christiangramia sp. OXR-203]|jgi:protein-tyrosine phosphatase|uniref:tyrosine-protein phosphatase n=1 Tax=Christiangramia sp. OXR-203 TaxID=3100176 RepID=UPI002AC8E706|nr:CpsB/CapC family capsule biosynthesis tyrosine phosphatase [Christiangramia sp. OXR-203]WPY99740.1 CpsB/CapC family capsule biosynthesis tyrosine phosphatase [Christiangramia sp. OXR-203]
MLSIFNRSKFLIDLIEGIPDFHNHTLPGIDDGSDSVETSRKIFNSFSEIGINQIVATPHIIGEYYPNTPFTIEEAYNKILQEKAGPKRLTYAAEYMMDQHFLEILKSNDLLTITENKVLVEMSYFQAPINLTQILFKVQNNSKIPILAHPERYTYMHSKDLSKYKELKTRGCLMQINMLSLSNHYGKGIQKMAYQLIENGLIEYICSDVHKLTHLEKIKEIKVPNKYTQNILRICDNNRELLQH